MTTRITLAILLTTWVILIVGETAAFLTARSSLLALLDDTIITRASALLETSVGPERGDRSMVTVPRGDDYRIEVDPAASTAPGEPKPSMRATLVQKQFETLPDGRKVRSITLRTAVLREGRRVPMTITYKRPTDRFDWLMSHLGGMLLLISLACGLTTAWLALKLSRAALQPLHRTADLIAQIDEQNLGRRIDASKMPSELVPMSLRLNEMLERLESGFRERKRFLADAAHELRTPTASLLTTMEVALRRPREHAELIAAMHTGLADARRLRKLVEQLMEHARSEHLRGPESMQPTDVPAMLRECVEIVTPLAREKDVTITSEIGEQASPFVTQRDRMRSVVLNLLSNAIEYNKQGGAIRLTASREDGVLQISVADTGVGIAKEQLPQVFEPFFRGVPGRGDDPEHLGLGLFLVRSHVEALHGAYQIDSTLGEGTTLKITLPEPKPA